MSVKITYKGQPILRSVIEGRKKLKSAVEGRYKPNAALMKVIGEEIIEGFKGGRGLHMEGLHFVKGRPVGTPGKAYPRGIRREKSPDGTPYADLSEVTKKIKRKEGSHYTTSILQFRGGTSPHSLINSLRYRVTYSPSKTGGVTGGVEVWMEENNEASIRLENGGDMKIESGNFKPGETKMRTVYVPPRPHREVQPMVNKQIQSLLSKWAEQDNGKSV